jgi:hypothetical protein
MEALLRLRRFLDAPHPRAHRPEEVCEICGVDIPETHPHVLETTTRRFLCACRACYLLFTRTGAAAGKYRSIPDRYVRLPEMALDPGQFGIPVGVAFFFRNSALGRMLAFYPSPAGATESALPVESWDEAIRAQPLLAGMETDVEALLVCAARGRTEAWIVPIDACYELVGRLRRHWKGFDGGSEAWREIDAFFEAARAREDRSTPCTI